MNFDLQAALPDLLPSAKACAEVQSRKAAEEGSSQRSRSRDREEGGRASARADQVMFIDELPLPDSPCTAESSTDDWVAWADGQWLALGHGILIVGGVLYSRLLAHECRDVFQ
jgi:hypothetical protein